jgi:hypothetical protein
MELDPAGTPATDTRDVGTRDVGTPVRSSFRRGLVLGAVLSLPIWGAAIYLMTRLL